MSRRRRRKQIDSEFCRHVTVLNDPSHSSIAIHSMSISSNVNLCITRTVYWSLRSTASLRFRQHLVWWLVAFPASFRNSDFWSSCLVQHVEIRPSLRRAIICPMPPDHSSVPSLVQYASYDPLGRPTVSVLSARLPVKIKMTNDEMSALPWRHRRELAC
jgi:hypothetical protein